VNTEGIAEEGSLEVARRVLEWFLDRRKWFFAYCGQQNKNAHLRQNEFPNLEEGVVAELMVEVCKEQKVQDLVMWVL